MANFVDNKEFLILLKDYKKLRDEDEKEGTELAKTTATYQRIGVLVDTMGKKLLYSPRFINYSDDYKAEMYSEAMYNCTRYMHKFNTETKNNPFAYFTQIIWNAFLYILNKERKIKDRKQIIGEKLWGDEMEANE